MSKVVIIGAGHVGSHCAEALAQKGICREVVLLDRIPEKAASQAMDVADSLSFASSPVTVRAGCDEDCKDADIIVISIGEPRKPGQTRLDLLFDSAKMADDVIARLREQKPTGIVIVITNPVDVITEYIRKGLEMERWRCFGTGTLLDTARLLRTISELTGVARSSIEALSLGEHGDSSMISFSHLRIAGKPFDEWNISREQILERTRNIGMDIINGKGSTEFGIGNALASLVKTILTDEKKLLPASVHLDGEYGQHDISCGVPCIIGKNGIESILTLPLTADEQEQFDRSCGILKQHLAKITTVESI